MCSRMKMRSVKVIGNKESRVMRKAPVIRSESVPSGIVASRALGCIGVIAWCALGISICFALGSAIERWAWE